MLCTRREVWPPPPVLPPRFPPRLLVRRGPPPARKVMLPQSISQHVWSAEKKQSAVGSEAVTDLSCVVPYCHPECGFYGNLCEKTKARTTAGCPAPLQCARRTNAA